MLTRSVTLAWIAAVVVACGSPPADTADPDLPPLPGQSTEVFTTARPSIIAAAREYFQIQPAPVQPVEFPHDVHVSKGITCTAVCHVGAEQGAVAGLPSVATCMVCHSAIATDRPRIRDITALHTQGIDLTWQRVYGFSNWAHVRFNHAPHVQSGVECATCHGDIAQQTVAQRNVDLNMGFCVTCHRENDAPDDCLTCHL